MIRVRPYMLGLLLTALPVCAEERPAPPTREQLEFFETKIRPVLVTHCYECHAAEAKIVQGGLRVDHRAGLLKGGDSGAAITPGKADKSLLLNALRYDGIEMPPKGKLSASVVKDFETWIAMGRPIRAKPKKLRRRKESTSKKGADSGRFNRWPIRRRRP